MSALDVSAQTQIAAAPADVAAVMFDPAREPEWIGIVNTVEVVDPALAPGAVVNRTVSFLGHETTWTTEVAEVHFPHKLTLLSDGLIRGAVDYTIARSGMGSIVRVRHAGHAPDSLVEPAGGIDAALTMALTADLAKLKTIVERT